MDRQRYVVSVNGESAPSHDRFFGEFESSDRWKLPILDVGPKRIGSTHEENVKTLGLPYGYGSDSRSKAASLRFSSDHFPVYLARAGKVVKVSAGDIRMPRAAI